MTQSHFDEVAVNPLVRVSGLTFIEQLHAIAEIDCVSKKRPFLSGVSAKEKRIVLISPTCKMWNCPACSARNARQWIARIINGCNKMDTADGWFMFTLTAHEKWRGDASVKNLRQGWKKLYNRIRRKFGTNHYVKVWEKHKDGTFHLHGLVDACLGDRWLRDNARSCGMGYEVEISKVENAGQVAGYIAKYFLKSEFEVSQTEQFPKGLRRIEVSRSWLKLPDLNEGEVWSWTLNKSREGQLNMANHYEKMGFQVYDTVKTKNP